MKKIVSFHFPAGKWKKTLFLMRINLLITVCAVCTLTASPTFSQQARLDVSYNKVTLGKVLSDLKKRSGFQLVFFDGVVPEKNLVTLSRRDATLEEILDEILPQNGLAYSIKEDVVSITRAAREVQAPQQQVRRITVTGRVTDEKGSPLIGVNVVINQSTRGVATNSAGRYSIDAREDDVLKFSYIGYVNQTIPIEGRNTLNVSMQPTDQRVGEVTVVAFGQQKTESVVSAITTVRPESLRSSNSDLTSTFAGRIPGMIAWQTGGLPGALTESEMNTKFYIRGITSFNENANIDPLILLDGVEVSKLDLARIDPEDIESFTVLKDATATAMYGARGANGVIQVHTKKGEEGSVYTSVRYESIASMPTRKIDVVDPVTYMKAYNEALIGRNSLATPLYTADKINNTGSDRFPSFVYPANDWYDMMFKTMSVNHHMGLNIRGGSKTIQYYASLNHNLDHGMLRTDRLNDYDVNIRNNTTQLRVNLNIDLTPSAKLVVNTTTTMDKYHGPSVDAAGVYSSAFNANPVDFAAVYPADDNYAWPHIRYGGVNKSSVNPYSLVQSGYSERSRYATVNRLEYIQNLSTLLHGLELRGNMSFYQEGYYSLPFETKPYMYRLLDYDHQTGVHTLAQITEGRRTLELNNNSKVSTGTTRLAGEVWLMHNGAWGDHTTSYTTVFNLQQTTSSVPGTVFEGIPSRNMGLSMRLAYGYKERYYLEGSFGYNGSERFARHNRFGFFPATGAAWVLTKEPFMKSVSKYINFLKFRVSYGKTGNDGIGVSELTSRFVYLPNININAGDHYNINSYANPNIKWEIAETVNFGMELRMLNNLLDFTLDAYQEVRHNILSERYAIPATMGLGLFPMDNIGKVRSRGFDFQAKVQHAFRPDFWFILNGTLTYNKATFLELDEAYDKPAWQRSVGKDISQQIGYIAQGLFQTQQEIDRSPKQSGDVMPGDIRYRDVNGDGIIDVYDAVHIGFPTTPRLIYGFSGVVSYKAWEFNFAFQGSGQRSLFMNSAALSPFVNDHALMTAIYKDHWSPDNMKINPLWPRLSTNSITFHNQEESRGNDQESTRYTTYFMREVKFLRCQSLELAYSLPEKITSKLHLQRLKLYVRTNNPFVISNFDLWDIELGSDGFNYPIQRTYSIGVNISF